MDALYDALRQHKERKRVGAEGFESPIGDEPQLIK